MADATGTATPLGDFVRQFMSSVSNVIAGATSAWMGPNQPLAPQAQQTQGRAMDYPVGQNLMYSRRVASATGITFAQLRELASTWDLLRLVIESRKDQLEGLDWHVVPVEGSDDAASEKLVKEAQARLRRPDNQHTWQQWLRMMVEDILVLDAVAVYKRRTYGGDMYSWDLLDASTIHVLIDPTGRSPMAPEPAYQQILKGVPTSNFTHEELLYAARNVRTNSVYGYGPVEQILFTVNTAIRRATVQLDYYKEGNIPAGFASLPKEWTPEQISTFQKHWDSIMAGNAAQRNRVRFVPGDTKYQEATQPPIKDQYDEWLAKVVCYAFSVSSQPFVSQVNRATAETQQEISLQEGLKPLKKFIKAIVDQLLFETYGYAVEFKWQDDVAVDAKTAAEVAKTYVEAGIKSRDEVRAEIGLDTLGGEAAMLTAGTTLVASTVDTTGAAPTLPEKEPAGDGEEVAEAGAPKKATATLDLEKVWRSLGFMAETANYNNVEQAKAQLVGTLTGAGAQVAAQVRGLTLKRLGKASITQLANSILKALDLSSLAAVGTVMQPYMYQTAKGNGQQALTLVGLPDSTAVFNVVNDNATAYAALRAAELVSQITDTTREELRDLIADALANGETTSAIAARIEQAQGFGLERADLIAATEVGNAAGAGALMGYKAAAAVGVKVRKRWLAEDTACEVCQGNEKAGPLPLNRKFPSGDAAPLGHPRCRCVLVGVVEDAGDE